MKQQEVVPALELFLFIYSSMRVVFPVDLDLGTELVHGKSPGRVTLVRSVTTQWPDNEGCARWRCFCLFCWLLPLAWIWVSFCSGFIQNPSGDAVWWDRMSPVPSESHIPDFRQFSGRKIINLSLEYLYMFRMVMVSLGLSGSLGSFTRQSVIKPCHSFNANSHSHFFHVHTQSHTLFFFF